MLVVPQRVGGVKPLIGVVDDSLSLRLPQEHERVLVHPRADDVVARVLVVDHRAEVDRRKVYIRPSSSRVYTSK